MNRIEINTKELPKQNWEREIITSATIYEERLTNKRNERNGLKLVTIFATVLFHHLQRFRNWNCRREGKKNKRIGKNLEMLKTNWEIAKKCLNSNEQVNKNRFKRWKGVSHLFGNCDKERISEFELKTCWKNFHNKKKRTCIEKR